MYASNASGDRMFTFEEVNALGQFLDSTWGRSSTNRHTPVSVKSKLNDQKLTVIYTTYATVGSEQALSKQLPSLTEEGKQVANAYLKDLKAHFKSSAGRTLETELLKADTSVEIVSLQPHVSPRRTVAFRFISIFRIE